MKVICQQIGHPREKMDNLQKNMQPSKTESGEIENLKRLITSSETESVMQNSQEAKVKDWTVSQLKS